MGGAQQAYLALVGMQMDGWIEVDSSIDCSATSPRLEGRPAGNYAFLTCESVPRGGLDPDPTSQLFTVTVLGYCEVSSPTYVTATKTCCP